MPLVTAQQRIRHLKKARDAAKAIKERIDRRNRTEIDPDVVAAREPTRQRAVSLVQDVEEMLDDLGAAQKVVTVDTAGLENLQRLAGKLDTAITGDAFLNLGIDTLTQVLNDAASVKDALG
jgi:hypothetical protein